jgi:hypothetical protein
MSGEAWTSLEKMQLAVNVLTPLSVVLLGWFISHRLKRLDLIQFSNQKLIEKRLAIFDAVAPKLNALYCFFSWRGYWRDVSPGDVIDAKRELDKTMRIYRGLFDDSVYDAYDDFINTLFEPYAGGPGRDARIRSVVQRELGDNRKKHGNYQWQEHWYDAFSPTDRQANPKFVESTYSALMDALTESLGVERKRKDSSPKPAQPTRASR